MSGTSVQVWSGALYDDDEGDPSLGVRELRKPKPPTRNGGAEAELHFEPEPEAEGIAQGARLAVGGLIFTAVAAAAIIVGAVLAAR